MIPIYLAITIDDVPLQFQKCIHTVNGVENLHRWPDNFILQSVRANLEGAARHWVASREIENWSDFER